MQLTFQKYGVGHIFIVNYDGRPTPYIITRIIPAKERQNWADEGWEARFHRQYYTKAVFRKHYFDFTMTEDEMDSHMQCSADELEEYRNEYYAHIAKNRLLDKGELYD